MKISGPAARRRGTIVAAVALPLFASCGSVQRGLTEHPPTSATVVLITHETLPVHRSPSTEDTAIVTTVPNGLWVKSPNNIDIKALKGGEFTLALQDYVLANSLPKSEIDKDRWNFSAKETEEFIRNVQPKQIGPFPYKEWNPSMYVCAGEIGYCKQIRGADTGFSTILSGYNLDEKTRYSIVTASARAEHIVSVLYGTDRTQIASSSGRDYSGDRGHRLELGEVEVSIPAGHHPGKVERPGFILLPLEVDPAKHFVVSRAPVVLSEHDFAMRASALAQVGGGLLFIHGYNQDFDTGLYRAAQLAFDFQIKGPVFYYSWPSRANLLSYDYDVDSVEQATTYFRQYLNIIFNKTGVKRLSIVAHSRGNSLLLQTLATMKTAGELRGDCCGQLIMASPDVDRDYARNIVPLLAPNFQGLTLYVNNRDKALAISEAKAGGIPRLGQLQENAWPLILSGMDSIDATAAKEDPLGFDHDLYVENSVLLYDMGALIERGQRPPDARTPTFRPVKVQSGQFWRMVP